MGPDGVASGATKSNCQERSGLRVLWRLLLIAYGFVRFATGLVRLSRRDMPRIIGRHGRTAALRVASERIVPYLSLLQRLDLVDVRRSGVPYPEPCVVVANHPSLLDIIVLLVDMPNAVCLFKRKSLDNPVLSGFLRQAGYVEAMDGTVEGNRRVVGDCRRRLDEGHHVVIFPEGTRSPTAVDMGRFRITAFHVALKAGVPIQPIAIHCAPLFLGKGQGWLAFCRRLNRMRISYLPVIRPEDIPAELRNASGTADLVKAQIGDALQKMERDDAT